MRLLIALMLIGAFKYIVGPVLFLYGKIVFFVAGW